MQRPQNCFQIKMAIFSGPKLGPRNGKTPPNKTEDLVRKPKAAAEVCDALVN